MQKTGQVSIDVIFSLIFAMLLIQQIGILTNSFTSSGSAISVAAQEKTIAVSIATIIESAQALNDSAAKSISINFPVPKIIDPDSNEGKDLRPCYIAINSSDITVSYPDALATDKIETKISFVKPTGLQIPANIRCGETLAITK
jgi:hypothetical protein